MWQWHSRRDWTEISIPDDLSAWMVSDPRVLLHVCVGDTEYWGLGLSVIWTPLRPAGDLCFCTLAHNWNWRGAGQETGMKAAWGQKLIPIKTAPRSCWTHILEPKSKKDP